MREAVSSYSHEPEAQSPFGRVHTFQNRQSRRGQRVPNHTDGRARLETRKTVVVADSEVSSLA